MPWPPTGWKAPSPSWWRPPGSSSRSSLPIQSSYRSWRDLRAFLWTMCLDALRAPYSLWRCLGCHQRLLDRRERACDVVGPDTVVGDGAGAAIVPAGEEHARAGRRLHQWRDVCWLPIRPRNAEEEDVVLDRRGRDRDTGDL